MIARVALSIAILASLASAQKVKQMYDATRAIVVECSTTYTIELEETLFLIENKKLPETENAKCFLECVMEKGGLIADGKLNPGRAKEFNAMVLKDNSEIKEKTDQVIDMCADVAKPDGKCEFGVEISKCAIKHAKELGISPPHFGK